MIEVLGSLFQIAREQREQRVDGTHGGKWIRNSSKMFWGGDIFVVGHRDCLLGLFVLASGAVLAKVFVSART